MSKAHVAYVGSYSYTGEAKGISIYDIDKNKGKFIKRGEIEVNNSSYISISRDKKTLYSIADEGVVSFRIHENGTLTRLNSASIRGMRGRHLTIDRDNSFVFVSGYHDGKLTVLKINEDGSIGEIVDEIYNKGLGSIAERNFKPHVNCTRTTRDNKFILSSDLGIDQIKIYEMNKTTNKLNHIDTIRCELNSAPSFFNFSRDGKYMYLMYEIKNTIDVFSYSYKKGDKLPKFEKIQSIVSLIDKPISKSTATTCFTFTRNGEKLVVACAGDNCISIFDINKETGILSESFQLPISGDYPKDLILFDNDKKIASINHESGSITFFNIDFEKKILTMSSNEIKVNQPNCCKIIGD